MNIKHATGGPLLVLDGLKRSFGKVQVLPRIDLELMAGERLAIRGSNGAGKTTLLRCVVGTLTPSEGEVRVAGHPAGTLAARRLVGASVSHERAFYMRLSGRDNLRFFARLHGYSARQAADTVERLESELLLERIAPTRVDKCSTGMIQQLAFARALLGCPTVLVLDEPTRSLDEEAIVRLWAAIDRRPQLTILMATHRRDDMHRCDKTLEL